MDTNKQPVKAKRTTKNSVFLNLFGDKKYLLQLYQTLHPEDADITEDDLDIVTIENILTDNLYNDLGLIAHGDKLLLLLEAQSTWTVNILIRVLMYLAQSYHEYCVKTSQSLYRSKKVKIPQPELFIIFTGNQGKKPEVLSLSEEFFGGAETAVEVKAKVIYESDGDDIINQYIIFCKVFDDQRKKHGLTQKAVEETIRICKDRNILRNYLENKEMEVVTIMMSLFDEEQIMKIYVKDMQNEAAKEADKKTAKRMILKGRMTLEEIAEYVPNLSMDELRELEAEVLALA
jgi:translation initiation factor 2 beta subunit (eIF-2beta)/eIF-5